MEAASHALERVRLSPPASWYLPGTGRVEEEQPGAWIVRFDIEAKEGVPAGAHLRVAVDKQTGRTYFPEMPDATF